MSMSPIAWVNVGCKFSVPIACGYGYYLIKDQVYFTPCCEHSAVFPFSSISITSETHASFLDFLFHLGEGFENILGPNSHCPLSKSHQGLAEQTAHYPAGKISCHVSLLY